MSEYLEYTVQVKAFTPKAILVDNGTEEGAWIPLSQIEIIEGEIDRGEMVEIVIQMKEWLAIEKGLE